VLRYTTTERGSEVVVSLDGEIANDPRGPDWPSRLREFLMTHYVSDGVSHICLDLRGVTRIDVKGVATLLKLQRAASDHGKTLSIRNATGPTSALLDRIGAAERLRGSR
jgi:ABC-type transporter Mla MlaB component